MHDDTADWGACMMIYGAFSIALECECALLDELQSLKMNRFIIIVNIIQAFKPVLVLQMCECVSDRCENSDSIVRIQDLPCD